MGREAGKLIVQITEDQREMARVVIRKGIEEGRNPRNVALDLIGRINKATGRREGGMIGITGHQAGYVENARGELASLSNAYFQRGLRDKRYDGMVANAIKAGEPLSKTQTDTILGRYTDRLLEFRGEAIARTEAINALRAGQHEAHQQIIDTGKVSEDQIERVWGATSDGRTRPDHRAMDGQKVPGLQTPFVAPDGSKLMFPGDTSMGASAGMIINCRCTSRLKINYFKGLR